MLKTENDTFCEPVIETAGPAYSLSGGPETASADALSLLFQIRGSRYRQSRIERFSYAAAEAVVGVPRWRDGGGSRAACRARRGWA